MIPLIPPKKLPPPDPPKMSEPPEPTLHVESSRKRLPAELVIAAVSSGLLNTCSADLGDDVPTPTKPLFCCTTSWDVPTASPPVEMVDVAVVDVALKLPKVGVDVATMFPDASVDRSELTAVPV